MDAGGNLYIADADNHRIRKVSVYGIITTVAGNGSGGFSGGGGPATSAQLNVPVGVALDANGNLYIADTNNARVRKVTPAGIIATVAGIGQCGIPCYPPGDGGPATSAQLTGPAGVAIDASGSLYIADNDVIRKVSPAGIISTIAGGGPNGYLGDGGPATAADLGGAGGVAVDASGNLYIVASSGARVRKVAGGVITTIAGNGGHYYSGDGGPATDAQIDAGQLTLDAKGNIYISANNAIRLLTPSSSECGYSVSSTSFQSPAIGESLTLAITTSAGCAWVVSRLPDWITVSGSATGSGPGHITLFVASNSGAPRVVQISVAGIGVSVNQASYVLSVSMDGVVSNATFTAPVVPGSIAAVFGNFLLTAPLAPSAFPLPSDLGGLSLQFNGRTSAPLFYASAIQVDTQIPWELAGPLTMIVVTEDGRSSAQQTVALAPYAPGIFSINGGGTEQGAILDADNRLVDLDNPAITGSTVVQVFCTGLGPVTNQPATGAPSPNKPLAETTSQPTVMIGGVPAQVQFSGLAPGYVGLYQVNALVPQGVASGTAVPVLISIAGVWSNTVTIAVQDVPHARVHSSEPFRAPGG